MVRRLVGIERRLTQANRNVERIVLLGEGGVKSGIGLAKGLRSEAFEGFDFAENLWAIFRVFHWGTLANLRIVHYLTPVP